MRIRTISNLTDKLDEDFAWRLKELANLKILVRQNQSPIKSTLLRAGVALAYAHWEGFVKSSVEFYLEFVKNQRVQFRDLAPCLVALSRRGLLHQFTETKKFEVYAQVVKQLTEEPFISDRASFGSPIRTSNLRSHVFVDISQSIGVITTKYEPRFNFIDVTLADNRNQIAHGEYFLVDEEPLRNIIDDVIKLLREFQTDIETLAVSGGFLRNAVPLAAV